MLIQQFASFIDKDIAQLQREIETYVSADRIWSVDKGITNSAGNLALHLVGNLNGFIGAPIGRTGYVRNRPLEFSQRGLPTEELIQLIAKTREVVANALGTLSDDVLGQDYPVALGDEKVTYVHLLTMLATHLSYHLGQVNYHRRLLDF